MYMHLLFTVFCALVTGLISALISASVGAWLNRKTNKSGLAVVAFSLLFVALFSGFAYLVTLLETYLFN